MQEEADVSSFLVIERTSGNVFERGNFFKSLATFRDILYSFWGNFGLLEDRANVVASSWFSYHFVSYWLLYFKLR